MSKDKEMIPRVTVRDWIDGEMIKTGLLILSRQLQTDYTRKATEPGADQLALTIEMNKRIEDVLALLRAVGDGTMGPAPTTTKGE